MSWRTVVVSSRAKLDFKMNYLIIRQGLEETRIFIKEIAVLMIESTAVSLTSYIVCELIKHNVVIIFCDHEKLPQSNLLSLYGTRDSLVKVTSQFSWTEESKAKVWKQIVSNKISNQIHIMELFKSDLKCLQLMDMHKSEIQLGDSSNREAIAAQLYFKSIFGKDFSRDKDCCINSMLNYGYAIILSVIAREIVSNGYLTQIGIKHCRSTNSFNLACDLMEPFRPLVDFLVKTYTLENNTFDTKAKHHLLNIFDLDIKISGQRQKLIAAIRYYVLSVFKALNSNQGDCIEVSYEL